MCPLQIPAFSAVLGVVSFGLIAKWLYMPKLQAMSRHDALIRLAAIHTNGTSSDPQRPHELVRRITC